MNYYPFHIGDYASATQHLSWDEDMAYRRLIDAYYTREEPLPLERRQVYRLARAATQEQREAVDTILDEFFEETPEGWRNSRCDDVIHTLASKREKASQSAKARWRNADAERTQSDGNANASENGCERIENGCDGNAPNTNTKTNTTTDVVDKAPGKPARFDPLKIALPDCIPADAWAEWIAYRRNRKVTVSEQTMLAQVGKLEAWAAAGHSAADIIRTSISNGWQGLFEPKAGGSQAPRDDRHRAHYDRTADNQTMQRQIALLDVKPHDGPF
ncbi:MAG TPA: YdaU family protein [Fluviicoccus sp.]|nr:YdaU family protein [Fluviicoccus sp.]